MVSGPSSPRCANCALGRKGTRANLSPAMEDTFTPGSPAFLEGQRAGVLSLERKHILKEKRDAARAAQAEGHLGYQLAAGRMVRFAGAPGGAPPRGRWVGRYTRWAPGGGQRRRWQASAAADGSYRYGQGRVGSQHPSD